MLGGCVTICNCLCTGRRHTPPLAEDQMIHVDSVRHGGPYSRNDRTLRQAGPSMTPAPNGFDGYVPSHLSSLPISSSYLVASNHHVVNGDRLLSTLPPPTRTPCCTATLPGITLSNDWLQPIVRGLTVNLADCQITMTANGRRKSHALVPATKLFPANGHLPMPDEKMVDPAGHSTTVSSLCNSKSERPISRHPSL